MPSPKFVSRLQFGVPFKLQCHGIGARGLTFMFLLTQRASSEEKECVRIRPETKMSRHFNISNCMRCDTGTNGSLVYLSKKEEKELVYYATADLARARLEKVQTETSHHPHRQVS
eukprot:5290426-Amphidinium_carterae.1